ncbi:hypothetical protein PIROE2DRAFT_6899 [Piromyces sp. E2]|nr:hypothetical protein PIROE2DRAFT_6899 [Piromyces sp. E2]|eukprot:OUM66004.1 hypothetical protein PIROE2DRAFT_6899 [Piromyces sp. E2]
MEDKNSSQNYGFKNNVSTLNNTTSNFNYIKDNQDSTSDNTLESPLDINLENATSTTINTNTNNQVVLRQQPLKTIIQKIKTNAQVNSGTTTGLNTTTTINNSKHKVQTSVSGITSVNNTSFQKPNTKSRSKKQNHWNQIKYKLPVKY